MPSKFNWIRLVAKAELKVALVIFFLILIKVVCFAEECVYSISDFAQKNQLACTRVQPNVSDINELIKSFNKTVEWGSITIENKNYPALSKYLFGNMTIHSIYLEQNSIETIEDGAFDQIKGLTTLGLPKNLLTQFKSSDALTDLTTLSLSYNNIRILDANSFNKYRQLINIWLDYNLIERIEPGVLDLPSLGQLFIRGNNLRECVNDTFASLPNLVLLWMNSNKLQTIQPGCFNGLDSLESLDLSNNIIRESISTFSSLRIVTLFNLASNSLTKISTNLLNGLTNTRRLILKDNFIQTIDQDAWKDLQQVSYISLGNNFISKLTPAMFKYATSLATLILEKNRINVIEVNAFAGLESYLKYLTLDKNRLEYLKNHYFKGLYKLKTLMIGNNLVSFIEVGTFEDLRSLATLNLSQNALFNIQAGVMSSLPSLKTLVLRQNCLRSMRIFTNLTSLSSLDLISNRITHIDFDFLNENGPKLEELLIADNIFDNRSLYVSGIGISLLDVSQTNLEVIKIDGTMYKLSSLNISNNRFLQSMEGLEYTGLKKLYLSKVNLDLFKSINLSSIIPRLTELDLSYNNLDDVKIVFQTMNIGVLRLSNTLQRKSMSEILIKSDTLIEVDLSGNKLSRVPIKEMSNNLMTLGLANNEIKVLEELGFTKNVRCLDLRLNRLTIIKKKWFEGLTGLRDLYLSNNMIEFIEPDSLSLQSLYTLELQDNRLKLITYVYFSQDLLKSIDLKCLLITSNNVNRLDLTDFNSLEKMDLSNNSLANEDIYNFRFASSNIIFLSLSFNHLARIDQAFLSKATLMKRLNFSHNQIAFIEPDSFSRLKVLEKLDLSYNRLTDLDVDLFDSLSFMTYLDLSHNHLKAIFRDIFKELVSLLFLGLDHNEIKLIEDSTFQTLNSLFKLTINSNFESLAFSKETFTGLESISFIAISPEYFNSRDNLVAVKDSLLANSGRFVVIRSYSSEYKIEYYRSISLNYPNLSSHYTYTECFNVMYLVRNGIQLNVNTEQGVQLFVTQCSSHIQNILKDL